MAEEREVVIVGAGIAGLATALALKRMGVQDFLVLERSPELRTTGAALMLYPNAWRALDALGVAHKLLSVYPAIQTASVTNLETGKKIAMSYSQDKTEVLTDSSTANILHLEDGTIIRTKVLIGCDGVQSVVAQWMGLSAPIDSARSAIRGLAIYQEGHGLKHSIDQFLSYGKRAGMIPLNDKELYWFITLRATKKERGMAKEFASDPSLVLREVLDNLAQEFPEKYLDVVQHSDPVSVSWAPFMLRAPWAVIIGPNHRRTVTVAGDAMHPMTPDLGQGGCSALEDSIVLARSIAPALSSEGRIISLKRVEEGMENYVRERRWRAAGLITGSYLSGWVQQGGSGLWAWAVKFFRDHIFYKFLYPRIGVAVQYDCGVLPPIAGRAE